MEKYVTIITNIAATFKNVDVTSSHIEKAGKTILLYSFHAGIYQPVVPTKKKLSNVLNFFVQVAL